MTGRTHLESVDTEPDGVAAEEDDDNCGEEHGHRPVSPLTPREPAVPGGLPDLPHHQRVHDGDQEEGQEHHEYEVGNEDIVPTVADGLPHVGGADVRHVDDLDLVKVYFILSRTRRQQHETAPNGQKISQQPASLVSSI